MRKQTVIQFIKFGLVGCSNVVVSYGIFLLFYFLFQSFGIFPKADYLIAQFIGYVVSIFWAFFLNRKFVFRSEKGTPWIPELVKTFISYSFTGVFLNTVLSYLWVEVIGLPKIVAPIINVFINVPINFILNKLWAFKGC